MTLGEIIKQYRQEHSLSQDAIAEASGLSKAYISILERNRNPKTGEPPVASLKSIKAIAKALNSDFDTIFSQLDPDLKISISEQLPPPLPSNATPYVPRHQAPILGTIPAGYPELAFEDIEGYADIPYSDEENYFFLRVKGDSMEPKIRTGDLVLIRRQPCAEDGQIVAARVNGDEATLKRFKQQGDTVLLLPENPTYEPRIVSAADFERGYAQIIGVVLELRRAV